MGHKGMRRRKKKEKAVCLSKAQIATLLEEDRKGDVCETARKLIDEVEEEYELDDKRKRKKGKERFKKIVKEWF
jgi:hypothetical protein